MDNDRSAKVRQIADEISVYLSDVMSYHPFGPNHKMVFGDIKEAADLLYKLVSKEIDLDDLPHGATGCLKTDGEEVCFFYQLEHVGSDGQKKFYPEQKHFANACYRPGRAEAQLKRLQADALNAVSKCNEAKEHLYYGDLLRQVERELAFATKIHKIVNS